MTTVKYQCDSRNLTGTFAGSKNLLTEKSTKWALVTPTPGKAWQHQATTWTNDISMTSTPLGTSFCEILIKTQEISSMEIHFKNVICNSECNFKIIEEVENLLWANLISQHLHLVLLISVSSSASPLDTYRFADDTLSLAHIAKVTGGTGLHPSVVPTHSAILQRERNICKALVLMLHTPIQLSNCFKILHRAWQCDCHALCKISKWLGKWEMSYWRYQRSLETLVSTQVWSPLTVLSCTEK